LGKSRPERRDPSRENPDVNQARRKDESNPARGDVERSGGDNRGREPTDRGQQRQ
jgi:hypothetical protein